MARPGKASPVALLLTDAEMLPTTCTPSASVEYITGPPLTPLIATPSIRYACRDSCRALIFPEKKHRELGATAGNPSNPTSAPMTRGVVIGRRGIKASGN